MFALRVQLVHADDFALSGVRAGEFDWAEMFDSARHASRFLFEHNWRKRPFYSFARTYLSSLRPFHFLATGVDPRTSDEVAAAVHLVMAIPAFFVTLHGAALMIHLPLMLADRLSIDVGLPWSLRGVYGEISDPTLRGDWRTVAIMWAGIATVSGGATILLVSLRQTLGRCRVRPIQALRVCAYAAMPAMSVTALVVHAMIAAVLLLEGISIELPEEPVVALFVYWLIFAFPFGLYLWAGLSSYLRLPRPLLLGMTASSVAVLAGNHRDHGVFHSVEAIPKPGLDRLETGPTRVLG